MNELTHHGVKGMRWGVRRKRNYKPLNMPRRVDSRSFLDMADDLKYKRIKSTHESRKAIREAGRANLRRLKEKARSGHMLSDADRRAMSRYRWMRTGKQARVLLSLYAAKKAAETGGYLYLRKKHGMYL